MSSVLLNLSPAEALRIIVGLTPRQAAERYGLGLELCNEIVDPIDRSIIGLVAWKDVMCQEATIHTIDSEPRPCPSPDVELTAVRFTRYALVECDEGEIDPVFVFTAEWRNYLRIVRGQASPGQAVSL